MEAGVLQEPRIKTASVLFPIHYIIHFIIMLPGYINYIEVA